MTATAPTLAGFLEFIRNTMGITVEVLPDDSPVIPESYDTALEIASTMIASASVLMYRLAVYNLAGDFLLNNAQDVPDAPPVRGSGDPGLAYFAFARKTWNINGFVSGVIQSSGDEGTSESMVIQKAAETFTLADIQNLKTPYGRRYLSIAQQLGTMWGLS